MKSCPYCGHEVLKTDCYCPECGHVSRPQISLDKYNLGLIENFKQCLVYKYADFDGRASRSEYWHFFLVYQLLFVAILFTCAFLSYISPLSGESQPNRFGSPTGQVVVTKQMARELGLIDTTPSMGLTAGLFCAIFVLWFLVDKLLMTSAM